MSRIKSSRFSPFIATAIVGLAASASLATNLNPGQTLNPCPGAPAPSGTTLLASGSVDFALHYVQPPIPGPFRVYDTTGRVSYGVYRKADNTLAFRYSVTDDPTSDTVINHFTLSSFAGFATDVHYATGFPSLGTVPTSVTRSSGGSFITFNYDLGFIDTCRSVWIETDATAYTLTGQATIAMFPNGNGSGTIGSLPRPIVDSTPPIVNITSPALHADMCDPIVVTGNARDSGGFVGYTVEYATGPNGPWTNVVTSSTQVTNGTLATIPTGPLSQGWYFIRVTGTNTSDASTTATVVVWVDKQFDAVVLRSPGANQILGGIVCFDGTIDDGQGGVSHYTIEKAPLPAASPYQPVAAASYPGGVVNDPLAGQWNTRSGPSAVPDGAYRVRITGYDTCGHTLAVTRDVIIDNTPPVAVISSPSSCGHHQGSIVVRGQATDANMLGWTLQYTGGDAHGWVTIASGSTNKPAGSILGTWNTAGLRPCAYTLRLIATDASAVNCSGYYQQTEHTVSISIGCPADVDDGNGRGYPDGGITVDDLLYFLERFDRGC